MIDEVKSTKLPNGIAVLTEHMPGLRSVAAGIWVRRGSRHETAELNGICHFIEHAVFKGTRNRSARDIAVETDRLGGNLDAYTTHEMTGFATKVADTALSQAIDLLADLVAHPRFEQEDLEREQKVILEEMKMVEDTPDELLGELFNAAYFPNHPLGRPIEGTRETVATFDHKVTVAFHAREFSYSNFVVAAAGNVNHDRLVELVATAFDGCESGAGVRPLAVEPGRPRPAAPILIEQKSELEQAHLVLATPWPHAMAQDRYAASLLSSIIGGGTSSRLWQKIREERGLAYSVFSGLSAYRDAGNMTIYAGCAADAVEEVIDLCVEELRGMKRAPVPEAELRRAKDHLKGSLMLSLENTASRMSHLARQEIYFDRHFGLDETLTGVELVTETDVQRVAHDLFSNGSLAATVLGPAVPAIERARIDLG